jgi:hypothetical protein
MPRSGVTTSSCCSAPGSAAARSCAWAGIGAWRAGFVVVRATGCWPITGIGAVTGCASAAVAGAADGAAAGAEGAAGAAAGWEGW